MIVKMKKKNMRVILQEIRRDKTKTKVVQMKRKKKRKNKKIKFMKKDNLTKVCKTEVIQMNKRVL